MGKQQDLERVIEHLRRLQGDGFYGSVTITFQAGAPCAVREERVRKVEELAQARKDGGG